MNILVAIDTSAGSETVIGEVSARPWPSGSTLSVLTVVEPPYPSEIPELYIWAVKESDRLVRDAAERLCACGLKAAALVKEGDPKAVIVEEAERMRADLLIVGASGHSGITRFLVGSVGRTAVRFAHCSVEIVRPRAQKQPGGHDRMRVLLATDGSECSAVAAQSIAKRPWPANSEFEIVSVVEPEVSTLNLPHAWPDSAAMEALRAADVQRAQKAIAEAEATLANSGLKVSDNVLIPIATPKELILDEAGKFQADLVVVGSHGRRGIKRFLLGSVSEAVAMHANCSVEVIR
jgi:nucleotide-binding universal stress UspA family protein